MNKARTHIKIRTLAMFLVALFVLSVFSIPALAKGKAECALANYMPDPDSCWFCPMFRVLFNTASSIALNSYQTLASSVANLVIMAFALWISIVILKHVGSFEVKDPSKMLKQIMDQAFRVLVVVLILKGSFYQVTSLTLEPVFKTGMSFAQAITGNTDCPDSAPYMQNIRGYDSSKGLSETAQGGLPASMGKSIVCTLKNIQDSTVNMMAFGRQAMCVAWGPKAFLKYIIPSFPYLITGLVIYLGGLLLLVAFPWCLVDCVLQMSIAAGLAPAAIGAWAFKVTSQYLKTIWNFFMNAMFNFVFLSIIIYIIMTVVNQFMGALKQHASETTGWDFFADPIEGLAYWGVTGTKLVVVCLMGWVFLDEGKNFANKFAKGADMGNIGKGVGETFAQAAKKAGGTAVAAGKAVGGAADLLLGQKARQIRDDYRKNRVKKHGKEIKDEQGNVVGYERTHRSILGKKITRKVDIGQDGKEVFSKSKQSVMSQLKRDQRSEQKASDSVMSVKTVTDKNGNIIKQDIQFDTKVAALLVNRDGTLNMEAVNRIKSTSKFDEATVNLAIAQEVLKARGTPINNLFTNRKVSFADGKLHLEQTNVGGSTTQISISIGGDKNNQMLTQVKTTQEDRSYTILKDNGIQNSKVTYNAGSGQSTVTYGFSDRVNRAHKYTKPLDVHGNFNDDVSIKEAMYGFDKNDLQRHVEQIRTGKAQAYPEKKSNNQTKELEAKVKTEFDREKRKEEQEKEAQKKAQV